MVMKMEGAGGGGCGILRMGGMAFNDRLIFFTLIHSLYVSGFA